jgi:DNA-binding transcriptional LysR family regulator
MHIKSLKIFCDIVRRRSFSRAAGANGISQSSASQVVNQLEQRLGVQLLNRSIRPFVLTPEGERYYHGCRQLVQQYDHLEEEVRTLHDESTRQLKVASIYSIGLAHMSALMQRFSGKYPSARVRLEYLHPEQVYNEVEHANVDLGLVSYFPKGAQRTKTARSMNIIHWRSEPMVVVCHPSHRLARQKTVLPDALADDPWVAFEAGLPIRADLDRRLAAQKVRVQVALEFDNIETMKRAIEIDEGISILPEPTVAREIALGSLAKVPLAGPPWERPLGIIHRHDRPLGTVGKQFIQMLLADNRFQSAQATSSEQLQQKEQRRQSPVSTL